MAPHLAPCWPPTTTAIHVGHHRLDRPGRQPARHGHAVVSLHTGGRAEIEQRGRLTLTPGDVLLIPAGEPHRLVRSDGAEAWGLGLDASRASTSLAGAAHTAAAAQLFAPVRAGATAVVRISDERRAPLAHLYAELARELAAAPAGRGAGDDAVVDSLVTLIVAEVARAARWAPAASPSLVGRALAFIEGHCLTPISTRDVADAVARTPAHLTTALRRATGRTAGAWITAGRLAEAQRRLRHTDDAIADIAARIGYADATHFARVFRRAHGVTPAAWRARHRT